jgi:hypothetical protein
MGMSRSEAKERAKEHDWTDLKRLLEITRPVLEGKEGKKPSRVNRSMSRATAWNIYWRIAKKMEGEPRNTGHALLARNILREFGDSKRTKRPHVVSSVYHEDLDPIEEEE